MKWKDIDNQRCSVARTLSIIGDRWTLLVLRDCFLGIRRFEQFQERLGVTRQVLSDRLRRLVDHGILSREPYQDRPPRHEYRLTPKGRDLYPVMLSLLAWGDKHMSDEFGPPLELYDRNTGRRVHPQVTVAEDVRPVRWGEIVAKRRGEE
jgi:DNA-binding HxlR family transcriptional regulator